MRSWDDLRIFVAVAQSGGMSAAARKLRLNATTVSRRITALEQASGTALFERSHAGLKLTEAGAELRRSAEIIDEELSQLLESAERGHTAELSGTVRLATPIGLGSWIVADALPAFHEEHPNITIELLPEARTVSLAKREADIVITNERPPRGRLLSKKLFDYKIVMFASRGYVAERGEPAGIEALGTHRLVWMIPELLMLRDLRWLDRIADAGEIVFNTPSTIEQHEAISRGIGMGLLPNYMGYGDPEMVHVLPEADIDRTYWIVLHAANRQTLRVRAVLSFLEKLAIEQRHMWAV